MPLDHLQLYERGRFWVPQRLSDLSRLLINMISGAPFMADASGYIPYQNIHSRFFELEEGLGNVRIAIGDADYTSLMDLSARAKTLFLDAPDREAKECVAGLDLLTKIYNAVETTRERRSTGYLLDEDGEVTGD